MPSASQVVACGQMDGHDKADSCLSQLCKRT